MQTKTLEKEKNDFIIPESIQKNVNEKGFYLYEWISPKDVKKSIERDFLKTINFLGIPLAVILVVLGVFFYWNLLLMFSVFLGFIGIVSLLIIVYLLFFAVKRSILLSKNAFVVLTDSSLSINGKIEKYENIKNLEGDINNISKTFEENLFGESRLDDTKSSLIKDVLAKLLSGYKGIAKTIGSRGGKKSGQILIVILLLYTVYAFFMLLIYFVGVFILWMFGLLLTIINRFILLKTGNEVINLDDLFSQIDQSSQIVNYEKNILLSNLSKAKNNEWKDSLLLNINSGIEKISKNSNLAINKSVELKKKLELSKYSEMFNFSIYNSWIKKQIFDPLSEIYNLLEKNLEILTDTNRALEKQISENVDVSIQVALTLQKKRLDLRIEDIKKFMALIKVYMSKIN